jgi:hypothetical protein
MTARVALAAIIYLLEEQVQLHKDDPSGVDMLVLVTGLGRNSRTGESTLKPFIMDTLGMGAVGGVKLEVVEMAHNPGRLVLSRAEVARYVEAQVKRRALLSVGGKGKEEGGAGAMHAEAEPAVLQGASSV